MQYVKIISRRSLVRVRHYFVEIFSIRKRKFQLIRYVAVLYEAKGLSANVNQFEEICAVL